MGGGEKSGESRVGGIGRFGQGGGEDGSWERVEWVSERMKVERDEKEGDEVSEKEMQMEK